MTTLFEYRYVSGLGKCHVSFIHGLNLFVKYIKKIMFSALTSLKDPSTSLGLHDKGFL